MPFWRASRCTNSSPTADRPRGAEPTRGTMFSGTPTSSTAGGRAVGCGRHRVRAAAHGRRVTLRRAARREPDRGRTGRREPLDAARRGARAAARSRRTARRRVRRDAFWAVAANGSRWSSSARTSPATTLELVVPHGERQVLTVDGARSFAALPALEAYGGGRATPTSRRASPTRIWSGDRSGRSASRPQL